MTTEEMFQKLSDQLQEQGKQLREQGKQLEKVIQRQDEQGEQLAKVIQRQDEQGKQLTEMQTDITAIKLDIENHVRPMLQELTAYATSNSTRITMVERRTDHLEDDKAIDEVITEIKQKGLM